MATFGSAIMTMLRGLVDPAKLLPYTGEWVPEDHRDRLRQYEIFRALFDNRFGPLLRNTEAGQRLREYGDYALIVETSRDAVLGDQISIEVPGSADTDNAGAIARQQLLDQWAQRERWASKIFRGETDAAAVGDCVYELRPDGDRLRLRAHDPESFFPVWLSSEGEFEEAYLAWEEKNNGQYLPKSDDTLTRTRSPGRAPSGRFESGGQRNLRDLRNRDGEVVLYRRHYQLMDLEAARDAGVQVLTGAERSMVCVVTAAWYRIEVGRSAEAATGWDRLQVLAYEQTRDGREINRLDTGFDEVPLFYVPNKEATNQPWGLPEGESILHALLDLRQDHADLKENTFANAFPVLYDENPPAAAGPPRPGGVQHRSEEKYQPGRIYNGRKLGVVDLSAGNELLLRHEEFLVGKALRNSRTSAILAGVQDAGQVPSGYAMTIAMIPTLSKTVAKRTTRRDKLGMMLKHVLRWHRDWADPADFGHTGGWPAGMWDDDAAFPSFGSIIPIDKAQVAQIVRDLSMADRISDETAVAMLMAAGFPIDDAVAEIERLREMRGAPVGAPGSGMGTFGGVPIPGITDGGEDEGEE